MGKTQHPLARLIRRALAWALLWAIFGFLIGGIDVALYMAIVAVAVSSLVDIGFHLFRKVGRSQPVGTEDHPPR